LSSLSIYSGRCSSKAIRVPRSGLAYNLIMGTRTTFGYSSGDVLMPNCSTRGNIAAAEAPPNSNAERREGRTRYVANSGGKDVADSLRFLSSK
jgi:hypothetical protein